MEWPNFPKSSNDLVERIKIVTSDGRAGLVHTVHGGGTGAPGVHLEKLLGIEPKNKAHSDSNGLEIKYHGDSGTLIKLFHKEGKKIDGKPSMFGMVKTYGQEIVGGENDGCLSLRHTIMGNKSDRFKLKAKDGILYCSGRDGRHSIHWITKELERVAIRKVGHLAIIFGESRVTEPGTRLVRYTDYVVLSDLLGEGDFVRAILIGDIAVDLDAREAYPGSTADGGNGSGALRNHGIGFRVARRTIDEIWDSQEYFGATEVGNTLKGKIGKTAKEF